MPYTISIPSKKALIVHAGIVPGVPLDEQKLTNFINMRNLDIEDGKYVACIRTFRGEAWASLWVYGSSRKYSMSSASSSVIHLNLFGTT
jgi:hypothetical protein